MIEQGRTRRRTDDETRMRKLLANIGDSVTVVDAEGSVIDGTGFFDEVLGYPPDYWSQRSVWDLTDPEELDDLARRHRWVIDHPGEQMKFDLRLRTASGSWEYIELTAVNLLEDPLVGGIVLTSRNVSERKALERDLATQRDRAVAEARLRAEFTARASHELRNQIHALAGLSELVGLGEVPDHIGQLATLASRTAGRLQKLVDSLLESSSIGALAQEPRSQPTEVRHLLEDALAVGRAIAPAEVELHSEVAPGVPEVVALDEALTSQILANLVSNAAKFTDAGWVRVDVAVSAAHATPALVWSVSDSGRGIADRDRSRIFEAFEQAQPLDSESGSGLGLSICTELVRMLGGEIEVDSTEGVGSTFTVVLPFDVPQQPPAAPEASGPAASQDLSGWHILVVEDNLVNQLLVDAQLTGLGATVTVVGEGASAVDAAASQCFDAILMDWQLPGMDGLEATRRIRDAESRRPRHTPIIGITASARVGDRRICLAAGMDHVLVKPTSLSDLQAVLRQIPRPTCGPEEDPGGGGEQGIAHAMDLLTYDVGEEPVRSIVRTWLGELDRRLDEMATAVVEGDAETVRRGAHQLRATSRTLGAVEVDRAATDLENEDPLDPALLAALEQAAQRSAAEMSRWLGS